MPDKVKILYDAVSKDYDVGSFDEFQVKLQDDTKRKAFYDGVGAEYELGDFNTFSTKIKKKEPTEVASTSGTQTSKRGFEPFQSPVDTETPSVLTTVESDNARMVRRTRMQQQNRKPLLDFSAIKNAPKPKDAYYQDPTIAAREEKARLKSRKEEYERGEIDRNTFVQDLDYVAASGIDMVGRMASTLPSAILDNAISSFGNQFGGLAQTGVDAEMIGQYAESAIGLPQEYNPLSPNNFLAEKFRQKAELNQSLARKGYNGSITDALSMGKYKDAAKLTALGFTESLPILLGMAATRGAGLSGNGSLIALGLGTQGTTYQDLKKENPEIAKNILLLNATLTAIGEAGSEVTGTNMLYNQARKLFVKGQKEEAKKIVTKGIKDYLDYAFQKSFVGSAVLGDASGEVANQVWKNATDKWSGVRPDVDYLDGVGDAAIISMATTSVIASGAKALASVVNPKIKEKVDKEADKIKDLQKEADNPNIPDEVKVVLANEIANSTEIINESLKEDNEAYNKLDDDQKTEIDSLSDKKQRIEEVLASESVSDTSKEALQKELGKINSQIDAIIKKKPPIDPPATGGAMVEETETQALVDSKVPPLEKPTIDTEEQIAEESDQIIEKKKLQRVIDEGGSKRQLLQSYGINTNYGEWSQEDIDYNYQKILDEYGLIPIEQGGQDAVKTRNIEQSNIAEREGVIKQQQGQQEDRLNKEESVSQAEAETSNRNKSVESREVEEVNFAKSEIEKGAITWDGDRFSPRPDLGIEWTDIRKGQKDILAGKDTVPARRLIKAINKAREEGGYTFTQGSGAINNRMFVPISEAYETALTSNDIAEITANEAQLAKEYDEWFNSLSEEEKNQELNFTEDENIITSGESKENVSNQKDAKVAEGTKAEAKKPTRTLEGETISTSVLDKIPRGNTFQERLAPDYYEKLKNDIRDNGIKEPITLAYYPKDNALRLSEGHHRLKIAKELGITDIPVKVNVLWNKSIKENNADIEGQPIYNATKTLDIESYRKRDYFPSSVKLVDLGIGQKPTRTLAEIEKDQRQVLARYHDALKEAGIYEQAKNKKANPNVVEKIKERFKPEFDALKAEKDALPKTEVNEKAKTEEVKRPIETPRVAEPKGEVESAREEAKVAVNGLLDFVKKSRGNLGSFADVGTFSAKMALVFKAYAKLGIVKLKDVIAKLREDVGDEFVDENIDAIESSFNDFSGVPKSEPIKTSDDFTELAYKNIESDEFRNTLSNKERESGRELTPEEKRLAIQPLLDAFKLGTDIIEKAKDEFSDKYVQTLLDYIRDNEKSLGVDKVSLILISLENDLNKQMLDDPDNLTIKKQERMVQNIAIAYQRTVARALGYGKLRQIARVGYDIDRVTDEFFSTKQKEGKRKLLKAIESNMDDINAEAELQEQEVDDIIIEAPKVKRTAKEVKADISEVIKKMRANLVKAARGNAALSSIPYATQIKVVTPDIIKLAKLFAELGGMKAKEIIAEIRKEIKQIAPDVTEQDIRAILKGEQETKTNPKDRLEKAKERVKARIEELQQQIVDKKKELKIRGVAETDAELVALREQEKQLKEEANKYLTQESIDRINESKEKSIVTRLENELADLDEQIAKGEKERVEKKEPKSTPQIEALRAQRKAKIEILNELDPNPKEFTKQALIDAGYSREITVTLKDGTKEKRQVLDWKKLAGEEGSIDNIREVVENALKDKGFTDAQISRMRDAFVTEFNELRANIATKAIKELRRLNEPKEAPQRKSSARRLAELYDLGLFEQNSDEFDYLVNKAIGLSDVGQEAFFEAKRFAASLSELYKMNPNEFFTKQFVREINFKIAKLLNKVAFHEGGNWFKFVNVSSEIFNLMLRAKLQTLKQFFDNQISGRQERLIQDIGGMIQGELSTKQLDELRKKYASTVKEDITKNAGLYFGEVNTPFLTKSQIEDYLNSLTKDRLYHHLLSVALGKSYLEGADSMNKASLTEKTFIAATLKVMTDKSNPNRMKSEDALKMINEQLTGQKFSEALKESERIIKQINQSAGREILSETKENIFRGAMDLVKANLLVGQALDAKMIEASYNAAYKSAGYGLGHEANNPISEMVNQVQARLDEKIKKAVKEKRWGKAANLTILSTINRNILNPFVGGGTNWLVLGLQKSGLDVVSPLWFMAQKMKNGIDLSNPDGIKDLENELLENFRRNTINRRVLIGGIASSLFTLALISSGGDDEMEEWLAKNKWAKKYQSVFTPQLTLLVMAYRSGQLGDWVEDTFARSAKFEKMPKIIQGMKEYNKGAEPSKAKAYGVFGNAIGSSIEMPLLPVKFVRDLGGVYKYIVDKPQSKSDFMNVGFANGFFNYGAIDYMGFRPDRTYMRNIEEYIPKSDEKTIKFLRSKGLDINADSDQPIIYKGFSTYMSEEQAQKYDKKYGETVYGILKDKSESISDLSENDFKKVMKFIKNRAKDEALKTIGAVDNRASELTREGIKYVLPPDLLKKRTDYIETYIRKNKSSIRSLARETAKYDKVDIDIAIMIEEQALRDEANTDSGDIIYEKYKDKLMVKE